MAHYYLQNRVEAKSLPIVVSSRGVAVRAAEVNANANAIKVLAGEGIDSISKHQAVQIQQDDIATADVILVMTKRHRQLVLDFCATPGLRDEADRKTKLLQSLVGRAEEDVDDPYGSELHVYQSCYENMKPALDAVLKFRVKRAPLFDDWENETSQPNAGTPANENASDAESVDSWGLPATLPEHLRKK
eukprot:TRINITY_DN76926_c0_g1_i1.p1 TRINITY_DN76926_c0_g1~~TRINITY_DN76926_c0_g1_i1.p1  ORF type:complete len:220 (+),score=29.02 TRINITY_DN76926_c0_g1_i1:96-662(+)